MGSDGGGLAIHIGARNCELAEPAGILASSTARELVVGSEVSFADRGTHRLRGVPDDGASAGCWMARLSGR